MSSNTSNKITVNGNELDITGVDVFFVFECLKNLDADRQINLTQVAESLGYSNVASVGNRLRSLKKRYGFANFEGRTAAAAAKAAASATASNGDTSASTVKNETDSATTAPAKKKGRPARAKPTEENGHVNGTTENTTHSTTNGHSNGTTNGTAKGGKKSSSKRKRDDDDSNDKGNEEGASAGQASARPVKRARGRGRGRGKATTSVGPTEGGMEVNAEANRKAATSCPTEAMDPPLDMEELTETVRQMRCPADRMFLLAFETIKEARSERRLRREGPSGLKIRFKNTAA